MTAVERKKLQRMIDRTVRANNAFQKEQAALMEMCILLYGVEPGDVDFDSVIDGVLGGCGMTSRMTAEDFDAAMRRCIADGIAPHLRR